VAAAPRSDRERGYARGHRRALPPTYRFHTRLALCRGARASPAAVAARGAFSIAPRRSSRAAIDERRGARSVPGKRVRGGDPLRRAAARPLCSWRAHEPERPRNARARANSGGADGTRTRWRRTKASEIAGFRRSEWCIRCGSNPPTTSSPLTAPQQAAEGTDTLLTSPPHVHRDELHEALLERCPWRVVLLSLYTGRRPSRRRGGEEPQRAGA
jgi:hypothetical protein